jgi:hypothetical protein
MAEDIIGASPLPSPDVLDRALILPEGNFLANQCDGCKLISILQLRISPGQRWHPTSMSPTRR